MLKVNLVMCKNLSDGTDFEGMKEKWHHLGLVTVNSLRTLSKVQPQFQLNITGLKRSCEH